MNIKDFKESLSYLMKAQITPFVWGHAGLGKSSVVKQVAKEKGYHFFPLYLGTQSDTGDILGLAEFIRDSKGNPIATKFATPEWLKNAVDYCNENPDSGAIIFLDELNRARRDILQGMFSLALDKTFHTIALPSNCYVIAAGNPPTEEYQVTDVSDTAFTSRFCHIKLEPTIQEWLQYAKQNEYEPTLVSFVQEQPELLEDKKSNFDLPVITDRRSYNNLNKLFSVKTPSNLLSQLMKGIIGLEKTIAYEEHLAKTEKPLSAEVFFSNAKTTVKTIKSWSDNDVKSSLIKLTFENITNHLVNMDKDDENKSTNHLSENDFKLLVDVIESAPSDISYAFIVKICKEIENKEFYKIFQYKKLEKRMEDFMEKCVGPLEI